MRINDHRLEGAWRGLSPNHGAQLLRPRLIVMHFTASGGEGPEGDVEYLMKPEAKASAHLVVGRDGTLAQIVPFDRQAWHAGRSVWRGEPNCNAFSIGIEIDNWGKLVRTADGKVRSYTGREVDPARAVELTHKHERTPALWEVFDERQLASLADVTRLLMQTYGSLEEIVGHDDIAPGRKVDPGPAFPMERLRSLAEGRGPPARRTRTVAANRLNVRGGPGLAYEVLGQFRAGQSVEVLFDAPGAWTQVRGALDGQTVTAWVTDAYLR